MTRTNTTRKPWLFMSLLASLMMFVVSGVMNAQEVLPCYCEVGTITVGKVDCKFQVCIEDAEGVTCFTVAGGSQEQFKCHGKAIIYLVDCNGKKIPINNPKTNCIECICVGGCCVDACVVLDKKGCIHVVIEPSLCKKKCFFLMD